jgi:O-antigen ligase
MRPFVLHLGGRLSAVSWFFIELFTLIAVFSVSFSKSVTDIAIVIALGLWVLRKFPWDEPFPSVPPANVCYLVFLAVCAAGLWGLGPELGQIGMRGFLKWLKYFGIFFMAFELFQKPGRLGRLFVTFLTGAVLVSLNGYFQWFTGQDLVKGYSIHIPGRFLRMKSSFSSPNGLAAFLLLALPLFFWLWTRVRKQLITGTAAGAFFILAAGAFILTLSRSGFIALWSAAILSAFLLRKKWISLSFLMSPLLFLFSKILRENFLMSLHSKDITIGERFRFWNASISMIAESPFIGHGVNMFYQKFPLFLRDDGYRGYAHNCYLQMAAEVGLMGLAAFLIPLAVLILKEARITWTEKEIFGPKHAILTGLVAFLVQSFFDVNFYALQHAIIFWVFWGAFAALIRPAEKCPTAEPCVS